MDLHLKGKTVLVTGSSKGIGKAIAIAFHKEGCNVAINSRNESELDAVEKNINGNISVHAADVTDLNACKGLVDSVISKWGALDILVCNVGNGSSVSPGSETPEEWDRMMNLNLYSTTNMIEVSESVLSKQQGSIVCISSICGLSTLGAPLTYSAAKSALNSYIRGIAKPLAEKGIRINGIAPGNILCEGGVWERKIKEDKSFVENMLTNNVALRRLGKPEEIASFSVFLASSQASFSTGTVHVVDGGQIGN